MAPELPRDLVLREAPALQGYPFAFFYRSASTVGGDCYEFPELADVRLALAIGDASGHRIAAAMLLAISNAVLRLAVHTDSAPLALARMMNRALVDTGGSRAFLTLFHALPEPESARLDYVCAGHLLPLLRRPANEILRLGTGSFPLGLRPQLDLSAAAEDLRPGDLLLVYSDRIPSAVHEEGEAFGFERLQQSSEVGGFPQEVFHRILEKLDRFEHTEAYQDDRSLVAIRRLPGGDRSRGGKRRADA